MTRPIIPLSNARNALRVMDAPQQRPGMLTAYDQCKPLERIFVRAYVAHDDPIKAILAVSPELKGNTLANVRALDYMKRPLVSAAIAEEFRKIADRYEITADNVIAEVGLLAFARMGDYATPTEDGRALIADFNKIPAHELDARLAAISEFNLEEKTDKDGTVTRTFKFKLNDKGGNLDKLMKRFGLYAPERHEILAHVTTRNADGTVKENMTADEAKRLYEESLEE